MEEYKEIKEMISKRLQEISVLTKKDVIELAPEKATEEMDRAINEMDNGCMLMLRNRNNCHQLKLVLALKKIDNGTFGECEECGVKIDIARLKANPVADFCIVCQENIEKESKRIYE